ncbi:hypothetical protein CLF_107005, partial [Clonorchis sinensis]
MVQQLPPFRFFLLFPFFTTGKVSTDAKRSLMNTFSFMESHPEKEKIHRVTLKLLKEFAHKAEHQHRRKMATTTYSVVSSSIRGDKAEVSISLDPQTKSVGNSLKMNTICSYHTSEIYGMLWLQVAGEEDRVHYAQYKPPEAYRLGNPRKGVTNFEETAHRFRQDLTLLRARIYDSSLTLRPTVCTPANNRLCTHNPVWSIFARWPATVACKEAAPLGCTEAWHKESKPARLVAQRKHEMNTSFEYDRREILRRDGYVLNVVCRIFVFPRFEELGTNKAGRLMGLAGRESENTDFGIRLVEQKILARICAAQLRNHSFGVLPVWLLTLVLVAQETETIVTSDSIFTASRDIILQLHPFFSSSNLMTVNISPLKQIIQTEDLQENALNIDIFNCAVIGIQRGFEGFWASSLRSDNFQTVCDQVATPPNYSFTACCKGNAARSGGRLQINLAGSNGSLDEPSRASDRKEWSACTSLCVTLSYFRTVSDSPSYIQLATLIAGDSDVHTSAKERRLQPNKPYTIRQIRKLLAGFKVQSYEKTSLMGAPPKELPVPLRGSDSLLLGVVYRSHVSTPEDDHFLIRTPEQLSSSYHFTHLLLVGDFNAPKAPWTDLQCVVSSGPFVAALTEVVQQSAWTQHVVAPTRYRAGQQPSLLDLVITNERHLVDQVIINASLGHSDHCVLTFDFICYWARNPEPQTWIRNFCRADFSGMRIFLDQVKLGPASVEDLYRTIVQKVHEADAMFVPKKPARSRMSRKLPKRIRRLLEKRSQLFFKMLNTGDTEDQLAFRKMQNRCKSEIRQWNIRKRPPFRNSPGLYSVPASSSHATLSRRSYVRPLTDLVFTVEDIRQLLHKINPFCALGLDE